MKKRVSPIPYKDLLMLGLSGISEWKNEREMFVPGGYFLEDCKCSFTAEFLDDGKYIMRCHDASGLKWWMYNYRYEERHGKSIWWRPNGVKQSEIYYKNGLKHGNYVDWDEGGHILLNNVYINGHLML